MRGFSALLVLGTAVAAAPAVAEPVRYEIDPGHFSMVFSADHVGYGSVWGMFLEGSGSFVFDEEARTLSDLRVEIRTDSVFTNHEGRDGHLRSDAFLDAEAHPVATFAMTDYAATSETEGTVTGDLSLRGVTKPVTLDVTLNKIGPYPFGSNYVLGVTATSTVKRSDFGSTYAQGGVVGDDIPLVFELEAIRQGE